MTLETAFTRFLRRVLSWARFAGVPETDVDDVAQDVFQVFARKHGCIHDGAVPTWLRSTTQRIARRHAAKLKRHGQEQQGVADLPAAQPSQEQSLGSLQVETALLALVAGLRPERREVFVRHVLGEEPVDQIAAALGIPQGTAQKRLRLARRDLGRAIERTRATERRKTGGTSFALLPLFAFFRVPRRLFRTPAAIGAPVLGGVGVLVAWLFGEAPVLGPTPAERPAREDVPVFAPIVTFLEAPRELAWPAAVRAGRPSGAGLPSASPSSFAVAGELPERELVALARRALAEGSKPRARGFLARAERAYPRGTLLLERATLAAKAAP